MPVSHVGVKGVSIGARGRREQVMHVLFDAREPMSVEQVADAVGVHGNTARFHLERLAADGVATRQAESRHTPGRRRMLYSAEPINQEGMQNRALRYLLDLMAEGLQQSVPNPEEVALRVGIQAGRQLVPEDARGQGKPMRALAVVRAAMEDLAFAPAILGRNSGAPQLLLNNCPFAGTAVEHPEVICRLHVGLVAGILEETASGLTVEQAVLWDRPGQCSMQLRRANLPGAQAMRIERGAAFPED